LNEKVDRIQAILDKHNVDGWIIFCHNSHDIHQKYLHEKWISSATLTLIPKTGKPSVITSRMEEMLVDEKTYDIKAYKQGNEFTELVSKLFNDISDDSTIALNYVEEKEVFTKLNYDILTSGAFKALTNQNKNLNYISANEIIYDVRAVKTKKEIENHKISAKLAEELMEDVVEPLIKPGMIEKELAAIIEFECNKRGGVAFEPIVASGPNAAIPHHKAGIGKITKNQVLLIDYGVAYDMSNSDITHTYWIGSNPNEEVLRAYEAVHEAKEAAYTKIKAGIPSDIVELAVRDKFEEFGYDHEKLYIHSTGHPIGIETHDIGVGIRKSYPERPAQNLLENSVITVEPGLYFAGEFGVRLEDDCIVIKEGVIRISNTPKDIVCL